MRCSTYICVCSFQTMWSSSWRIWLSGIAATARTTTSPTTIVWRPMRIQIKSSPRAKEIGPRYRGLASKNYNLERVEPFHTCSLSYVKEHLLHGVMCEREHGLIFREISTSISRLKNKYHSRENTVQLFWWKKLLHGENQQTILVTVWKRLKSLSRCPHLFTSSLQQSLDSDLSDGPITMQEYMEVKNALSASEAKIQHLMKANSNLSDELRLMQKKVSPALQQ